MNAENRVTQHTDWPRPDTEDYEMFLREVCESVIKFQLPIHALRGAFQECIGRLVAGSYTVERLPSEKAEKSRSDVRKTTVMEMTSIARQLGIFEEDRGSNL